MKNFLKRLFIQLPLLIIWVGLTGTIITPIIFWLFTGELTSWSDLLDNIMYL